MTRKKSLSNIREVSNSETSTIADTSTGGGNRIMIGNPVAGYNVGVKKSKDGKLTVNLVETTLGFIDENLCLLLTDDDSISKKWNR